MFRLNRELLIVNAITFGRMPFVFLFLIGAVCHAYKLGGDWVAVASVGALILASVTDLFDGLLARRWKVESQFGAMADPLMDKVFYLVVFPVFTWLLPICRPEEGMHALVMMLLTVFYMLRDQWVTFLRSVGSLYQVDCKANWLGKFRTAYSFPLACVIYVYITLKPFFLPLPLVYLLEAIALAVNFWSMAVYTRQYMPALKKSMKLE